MFRSLSLGAFGEEDSLDIAREIVCDYLQIHRNRFAEFIEDNFDNYIDQLKKSKTWDGEIEMTAFPELFEVDIQVYKYTTSIVLNQKYIYPISNLTVRLYFLNGYHYNLFPKKLNQILTRLIWIKSAK